MHAADVALGIAGVAGFAAGTTAVLMTPPGKDFAKPEEAFTRGEMASLAIGGGLVGMVAAGALGAGTGTPGLIHGAAFGLGAALGGVAGAIVGAIGESRREAGY